MRVAILAESYLPYLSGVTVSTEWLARGLGARGHAVLLVAPRPAHGADPGSAGAAGPDPAYAWLASYQLPGVAPPGYRMPVPWAVRSARRAVHAFSPDVVHAQSPFVSGLLAARIARRQRVPLVFTHHTRFADYRHYMGPLSGVGGAVTDAYLRRFWRACAAVVAPSTDLAEEIRARLEGSRGPLVRVIPTGLDTASIAAITPHDARPEAGWPADAVVAVTLGRLAPEKRVELVLDAVAIAGAAEPRLRLLVVGGGPSTASLRRRADAADLKALVAFSGPLLRGDALARLRGADLFAFASDTETQGLVLAEALAAGLPAVALEGPGVRDSVRHEVDGVVVARGSKEASARSLGGAIAALAADGERRRRMAERALADAGRFDSSVRLAEMEALYADVVEGRAE